MFKVEEKTNVFFSSSLVTFLNLRRRKTVCHRLSDWPLNDQPRNIQLKKSLVVVVNYLKRLLENKISMKELLIPWNRLTNFAPT